MAITVQVKLNAVLRKHASEGKAEFLLSLVEGSTVAELISRLCIPPQEVWFATVDRKYVSKSQMLRDGDQIILFPLLTGG